MLLLDPMLATGNSTAAASDAEERRRAHVTVIALIAAPEGVAQVSSEHPDVHIVVASIDSHLNERGYIVPGLGDAGDRLYGTK